MQTTCIYIKMVLVNSV